VLRAGCRAPRVQAGAACRRDRQPSARAHLHWAVWWL